MTESELGNSILLEKPDKAEIKAIWQAAGRGQVPDRWWESAAAVKRYSLKPNVHHEYLSLDQAVLSAKLDELKAQGFSAIEIITPWDAGTSFGGLDTKDHYRLEPETGDIDDFRRLVRAVHQKGMAIIVFGNFGYCAIDAPFFLKACDALREGSDSQEIDWFLWSDRKDAPPPVSGDKFFMIRPTHLPGAEPGTFYDSSQHEYWEYSERAGKYYWTKWANEDWASDDLDRMVVRLPQYNWSSKSFQEEVENVIRFWMETGVDGWVIDAVNWYVGCTWEANRKYMTDIISEYGNTFVQPEGAGAFLEDPVAWITEGNYTCVQDYDMFIWWIRGSNVYRNAIDSGDPSPIEGKLRNYHDRVKEAGGTLYFCFEDPVGEEGYADDQRKYDLYLATVASLGAMCSFSGYEPSSEAAWIFNTKAAHPAFYQNSVRRVLPTNADHKYYAFIKTAADHSERILGVLNFQGNTESVKIDCSGVSAKRFVDLRNNAVIQHNSSIEVELPAYGYRFFKVLPS